MSQNDRSKPLAQHFSGKWVDLSEAIAWIVSRDTAFSQPLARSTDLRLCLACASRQSGISPSLLSPITVTDAKDRLLQGLRHGRITAVGNFQRANGQPDSSSQMPQFKWLSLCFDSQKNLFARSIDGIVDPHSFHEIGIQVDELLATFPPRPAFIMQSLVRQLTDRRHSRLRNIVASKDALPPTMAVIQLPNLATSEPYARSTSPQSPQPAASSRESLKALKQALHADIAGWIKDGADPKLRPAVRDAEKKGRNMQISRERSREAWASACRDFPSVDWSKRGPKA